MANAHELGFASRQGIIWRFQMAKQPWGGRPNKAALARIKLGTIVVSIVAFVATLGGVAYLNPGAGSTTPTDSLAQSTQIASRVATTSSSIASTSSSSTATSVQQQAPVLPVVRTRGS
jgi:hypothetical protein